MNNVQLIGRAGQNPEVKYTQNGTPVASFSLATSEKSGQGPDDWKTYWHRIVLWGKLAEQKGNLIQKGNKVLIVGKLQPREWTDNEGQTRTVVEVVAFTAEVIVTPPKAEQKNTQNLPEDDIPF